MKIHEHQAKDLLKKYNVPVLFSKVIFTAEDAGIIAYEDFESKGINTVVLKAQVHAGGNLAHQVYEYASAMLGNKLVTIQTGEAGTAIHRLLLEEGVGIEKEYYAGIVLDRAIGMNTVMVSTEGGVEIEKVAAETPELILKEAINPKLGFQAFQARRLGFGLGLKGDAFKNFVKFITNLVTAYEALDCSLLEINPLVLTTEGQMIALDAKMNFDDNALYRHPDYAELRDTSEENPLEVEASKFDLNYIKLDGNVGCMVNGAGLAMATMDMIQMSGGSPANFLDVGGGANVTRIANAFRIMLSDENVEAVLINIFGGIVRCDKVAEGIIEALKGVEVNLPVIVRLDGTNAKEGLKMLQESDMEFKVAQNFEDAAKLVTEVVSKN